jgi:CheY-like chemotaxis protein
MLQLLRSAGYVPIGAANGSEALQRLREGAPPCLILLDLMMPVIDGWEFRRRQLQAPKLAGIPVIVCTAYREAHDMGSLRVEHVVGKPIDLPALLDAISRCCARESIAAR